MFFSYLGAFAVLQGPVQLMFQLRVAHGRAQASLNRLNDVLMTDSSTPEPKKPMPVPEKADLILKDMEFRYTPDTPVLRGINLTIPFGQRVAFVGPVGLGQEHPGEDVPAPVRPGQRQRELRQRRPALLQDDRRAPAVRHGAAGPVLLPDEHPRKPPHRLPGATAERIQQCCEMASIWGFIESLPEGLDTVIGEGGSRLSGGQRQRLAIARALLHDPDYFVFDEATSALDTVSERMVQEAFGRILPGRTSVFIAHRLSTVKDCDRIIVLDEGRIVQDGTFEHLRSVPGLFQRMVESDDF